MWVINLLGQMLVLFSAWMVLAAWRRLGIPPKWWQGWFLILSAACIILAWILCGPVWTWD